MANNKMRKDRCFMADTFASRRGFISTLVGFLSVILLGDPKKLKAAARSGTRNLLSQLELEIIMSTSPERHPSVICRTSGEGFALYRETRGKRLFLSSMNPAGKIIWDACDGQNIPEEISQLIHERYLVSRYRAWIDTFSFLTNLKRIGAIL
jgi:hypothetical protein